MTRIFFHVWLSTILPVFTANAVSAEEEASQASEKASIDNLTCKEVAEFGKKIGAGKKLPDTVISEGKPCPKNEVAGCLLSIIDKVIEKAARKAPMPFPGRTLTVLQSCMRR